MSSGKSSIPVNELVFGIGRRDPTGLKLYGTCFAIGPNLVATAAHVSTQDDSNLSIIIPKSQINGYQDTTDRSARQIPVIIKTFDPIRDVSVLQISGEFNRWYDISNTDILNISDPINLVGFPHAPDGRLVLTHQTTTVGAKIILDSSGIRTKHIVLNIQSRPGQSGSPVFRQGSQAVCAMLIGSYAPSGGGGISLGGVDPFTLHQTTHAISAEYLRSLI